ncbi:MAG: NHLP leader peptide family RiPP precursor [Rubrobacteraceae bacterium]
MTEAAGNNLRTIRQRLIQRSVEDEDLRQRLLDDPRTTIEEEVGGRLPEELEIRAVEETPATVYLVLPPKLEGASEASKLSNQELESVAGGVWEEQYTYPWTCVGCNYSVS